MNRAVLANFEHTQKMGESFYKDMLKGMEEINLTDSQINEFKKEFSKPGLELISNKDDIDIEKLKCTPQTLYVDLDNTKKEFTFSLGGLVISKRV